MNKRKNWANGNQSLVAIDDEIEIDDELNKYEDMPLFENKMAIAKEIIGNSILPFFTVDTSDMTPDELHEKENQYIEKCMEKGFFVSYIAELIEFSETEVHSRIEEIKNTAKGRFHKTSNYL